MSDEAPKKKAMRVVDAELQAMAQLDGILAGLDDDQCQRVLMWLVGKHGTAGFRASVSEPSTAPSTN